MAISASGIGSGLDVDGLVSQLMAVERRPLTRLAEREAGVQARISAFGSMAGAISGLQNAARSLDSTEKFAATKATVTGTNAGFTATSNVGAASGSYAINVNQLASEQRVALAASAFTQDGDDIAAGTLSFGFGKIDALVANNPASTETLEFAGGSIRDLRDAINGADIGLSASVINDGTADRLVLSSTQTGAAQAFTIDGIGLAYSPAAPGNDGDPVYQLEAARDASLTVDGLTVTRASNTIDDVIDDVTLTLTGESASAGKLQIKADFAGARSSIEAFVNAYNGVMKGLNDSMRYDPETREGALLNGDSTARAVQSQLRGIVGGVFEGLGGVSRLPEIGIQFELDGTLSIDSARLTEALNDPDLAVGNFFAGTPDTNGFGKRAADALGNLIGPGGLITGRTQGLETTASDLQSRAEAVNRRLEAVEARYRAQFASLDVLIAEMTQTSTYLQQQLASLPGLRTN